MPENKRGRRDVPVGIPLDLFTMEWYELPKYNGIQVSQLIYKRGRGGKKTRGRGRGVSSRAKSGTTEISKPQPEMTAQDERQGETVIPHA